MQAGNISKLGKWSDLLGPLDSIEVTQMVRSALIPPGYGGQRCRFVAPVHLGQPPRLSSAGNSVIPDLPAGPLHSMILKRHLPVFRDLELGGAEKFLVSPSPN